MAARDCRADRKDLASFRQIAPPLVSAQTGSRSIDPNDTRPIRFWMANGSSVMASAIDNARLDVRPGTRREHVRRQATRLGRGTPGTLSVSISRTPTALHSLPIFAPCSNSRPATDAPADRVSSPPRPCLPRRSARRSPSGPRSAMTCTSSAVCAPGMARESMPPSSVGELTHGPPRLGVAPDVAGSAAWKASRESSCDAGPLDHDDLGRRQS